MQLLLSDGQRQTFHVKVSRRLVLQLLHLLRRLVLLAQLVGGLNPQQALDAPRICIEASPSEDASPAEWIVKVEEGMPEQTIQGLRDLGHRVEVMRCMYTFGRGQIIRYTIDPVDGTPIWSAGSDMRADGAAYPA